MITALYLGWTDSATKQWFPLQKLTWSNGDVEIGLADLAELPYVMGLVRQALERQMRSS
jgi:hypothetical protein